MLLYRVTLGRESIHYKTFLEAFEHFHKEAVRVVEIGRAQIYRQSGIGQPWILIADINLDGFNAPL